MNRSVLIAVGVGVVALGLIAGLVLTRGKSNTTPKLKPTPTPAVELLPQDALDVTLEATTSREYTLTIDKIPDGVTSLSYEITYDTAKKGTQGIVGSPVTLKAGQTKYTNDQIIFGTCSRNKCVLDEGVENIEITIRLMYKDGSEKGWKGTLEI